LVATVGLAAAVVTPSFAQFTPITGVASPLNAIDASLTGATATTPGTFSINGNQFVLSTPTLTGVTTITTSAALTAPATTVGGNQYSETFVPGTYNFSVTQGTTTFLAGTFTGGTITAVVDGTNSTANESFSGVTYSTVNQTYYPGFGNPGDFTFSVAATAPIALTGSGANLTFANFSGSASGQFNASRLPTGVPEPGTYAAFLVGGLGVLGLMVGARKRGMVA
jgi:hypothetical protein